MLAVVDALGNPLRIHITGVNVHDMVPACDMINDFNPDHVLASIVRVFQIVKGNHQTGANSWTVIIGTICLTKNRIHPFPIHHFGKFYQTLTRVDHFDQFRPEQFLLVCSLCCFLWSHLKICKLSFGIGFNTDTFQRIYRPNFIIFSYR